MRWTRIVAAAVATMAVVLAPPSFAAKTDTTDAKPEKVDRKQELADLRERIEKLQRDLAKSEESKSEAADALRVSEKAISEVNRNLVSLAREQTSLSHEMAELQQNLQATRTDVSKQQDLLDRTLRHQYMNGSTDALRLLLEGRDLAEVERQMRYLGYLSRERALRIARLKQTLATLAELEAAAKAKKIELADNAAQQKKARANLQAERSARQKVLTRVAGDIKKGRREIGRLKRDEDRLTKLLEQLAKALAKRAEENADRARRSGENVDSAADAGLIGQAFALLKGKLKLPIKGELGARFGTPREDGGLTWKGVFIRAQAGQPVKAVADGQVIFADWWRGYGNLLVIDHGKGYMSVYGNNESLLKQVGENVLSGETIASVGSTGGAPESGVYFELRLDSTPFDPMKWVKK
ncbi:MAG: peptidoglycan DD-metalloendopeptidase family protein [Betaproteobacteria bacterium]|nr:peptidoglycan DD-metalloendopeptidase family protein [Betaproteobacteria bacterium]